MNTPEHHKGPRRMWVNQTSTLQPRHDLHGANVLAVHEYGTTMRVYFLSGDTISSQMDRLCLSDGWRPVLAAVPKMQLLE